MSEPALVETPAQTPVEVPPAAVDTPPEPVSIADHAATFSPAAQQEQADEDDPPKPHHSAEQRRQKTGEFKEGKRRHRAQSQQASAEDVPRIQALTAKLRAAEEELTRFRGQPAQAPAQTPAQPAPQPVMRHVAPTTDDPEPKEDDEKYAGNYGLYLEDRGRWAARDEYRKARQLEQQQAHTHQRHAAFFQRLQVGVAKYPDFQQVALQQIPAWTPESHPIVHEFIMEDDNGADLLYHLQSHPQERDEILRVPPLQQAKRLTLLSQRFSSSSPEAAGTNGAAPAVSRIELPPKPSTPLRTEAQRATPAAPPTDGSLSIDDHARAFGQRLRKR